MELGVLTRKRTRKKKSQTYSSGDLNRVVDALVHPLYRVNKGFLLLDVLVHAGIEQDPKLSLRKFVKYNSERIVEEVLKLVSQHKK